MGKSILIYTFNKAASMVLHKVAEKIRRELKIKYSSINHEKDWEEIKQKSWKTFIEDADEMSIFGPIRASRKIIFPDNMDKYKILLHLRDPRDLLVSKYFSRAYNHARNEGRFTISDEEREKMRIEGLSTFIYEFMPQVKNEYELFITNLIGRSNVVVLKYETMVLDFPAWLKGFLQPFSEYTDDTQKIYDEMVVDYKNEFVVDKEDIYSHKRQVLPGDYLRQLAQNDIDFLNSEFKAVLKAVDYSI